MRLLCSDFTPRIFLFLVGIVFSLHAFGQSFTAGINTETPNPNAVLHLVSPNGNQGLMIPKLTSDQRTAMVLDADDNGLLVFDEIENVFYFWFNPNWVVLSTGSGQTLSLAGNSLSILNGNSIDLSPVDDQTLTLTGSTLSIDNGNSVDLGSLPLTEVDPTVPDNIKDGVQWSEIEDIPADISDGDADNQSLTLSGTDLSISDGNTVDLSTIAGDNQDLSLTGNTLSLTNDGTTVDLSGYLDNTDAQTLTLAGPDLSISDGNTVDLSGITGDNQDLELAGNTLSLTNDGTPVDLSGYLDNTDAQELSFAAGFLSISGGAATIDFSSYDADETDDITTGDLGTGVGQVLSFATANTLPALDGSALTGVTTTNFTGTLAGDVTGNQGATVVSNVGGETAVNVAAATNTVNTAPALDINAADDITTADLGTGIGQVLSFATANTLPALDGSALTGVTSINFSGVLAGDVTGNQGTTAISALQGDPLVITTPAGGDLLEFNGTNWANIPNTFIDAGAAPNAAGDIGGDFASGLVIDDLQGDPLVITTPAGGDLLEFNGTNWANIPNTFIDAGAAPNAAGDIGGDFASGLVIDDLQGDPLVITTPAGGDMLEFNGTNWINIPNTFIDAGATPNAAGDIGGDFASGLVIDDLQGSPLVITTPAGGDLLEYTGSNWVNIPNTFIDAGATPNVAGDIGGDFASGLVIDDLQGSPLVITTPAGGDLLEYTGSNWVNIPNTFIDAGATPNVAGDIGGDFASGLVIDDLQGSPLVITTPAGGDLLEYTGSNWVNIPNTFIDAGATPNVAGDIGGDFASGLVIDDLQGDPLVITTPAGGDMLEFNGTNWINIPNTFIDAGATPNPAGDIGGDFASGLVIDDLQGDPLVITTPAGGDMLEFNGTNWINIPNTFIDAGAAPNPAGDIGGDFASGLVIDDLQGDPLVITTPAGGDMLEFNGTNWINIPNTFIDAGAAPNPAGDIGGDFASGLVIDDLQGDPLVITTPAGGDMLEFNGTNWINIPNTFIDAGAAPNPAGDIGGDFASGLVIDDLQGDPLVITTPAGGDMLEFNGTNWINIPNTFIDAGAAPNPAGDIGGDFASGLVIDDFQGDPLIITTPAGGDILEFNGTNWINVPNSAFDPLAITTNLEFADGANRSLRIADGAGNNLSVIAGTGLGVVGGNLVLNGGGSSTASGGNVNINAGSGPGAGANINLTASNGNASGNGGGVTITAGDGSSAGGVGGAIVFNGGDATSSFDQGGDIRLLPGAGAGGADDGAVEIVGDAELTGNLKGNITTIPATAPATTLSLPSYIIEINTTGTIGDWYDNGTPSGTICKVINNSGGIITYNDTNNIAPVGGTFNQSPNQVITMIYVGGGPNVWFIED